MKISVVFGGGLGNQMFQYAFVLALRSRGHCVTIDTSIYNRFKPHNGYELDSVFNINEFTTCKKGMHLLYIRTLYYLNPTSIVFIDGGGYHPMILESPKRYLYGYWQDERYFADIKKVICDVFKFNNIDNKNLSMAAEMRNCSSVSIHIRRGDYAAFGMTLLGEDYYKRAINSIKKRVKSPYFYLFSDDKEEAIKIVEQLGIDYKLVSQNIGKESYKDMFLMSQCRHNIIANSSFSWWGGYLNQNPDKILIYP